MPVDLYDHQRKAVDELRSGSILCGGVGSGKSRTAIAYFFYKECSGVLPDEKSSEWSIKNPLDLYIITTAHKRDTHEWDAELSNFGLMDSDKIKVIVDSWNNIRKYEEVQQAFFILDEQRLVGKGAWVKSFYKIAKKNRWILLSATPGDTWSDYIPVFVANGFFKNRYEFLRRHAIFNRYTKYPKIEDYYNTDYLESLRKRIVVGMPYKKPTISHKKTIYVEYDIDAYKEAANDRWNAKENRPIRDAGELCYILRRIVNHNSHRCDALFDIMKTHSKVIVFYNFDYELEDLRAALILANIPFSELNGHKHEAILESDNWVYLVQYTAGAEGWNCIETDAMVFYSLNYSYKIMEQASGRINRMNTPYVDLYYYYIISNSAIDQAIEQAIKKKKVFNEKLFYTEKP